MKSYYLGYAFMIEPNGDRFSYTVYHASGNVCDDGYGKTYKSADRKVRRLIKMFASH